MTNTMAKLERVGVIETHTSRLGRPETYLKLTRIVWWRYGESNPTIVLARHILLPIDYPRKREALTDISLIPELIPLPGKRVLFHSYNAPLKKFRSGGTRTRIGHRLLTCCFTLIKLPHRSGVSRTRTCISTTAE